MKKTVSFDQTLPIEKVIKKYFPSNAKLYSLTEDEVAMCGAAHDVDIMHMFNDRTKIFLSFYSLTIPVEYYREMNNHPKICSEENENNVRFF